MRHIAREYGGVFRLARNRSVGREGGPSLIADSACSRELRRASSGPRIPFLCWHDAMGVSDRYFSRWASSM